MKTFQNRKSEHDVDSQFLTRVSLRAFSGEPIDDETLLSLFEAARWAPSSYNNQPWRFIYVRRKDKEWETFFNHLIDFNKQWCKNADALVLVVSRDNFEHNNKPARTAQLDTGAAWMSLALAAHSKDIVAHGMEGFDYEGIKKALSIPSGFTVLAMVALGLPGDKNSLPEEIRKKEEPSERKPLEKMLSRGKFNFS